MAQPEILIIESSRASDQAAGRAEGPIIDRALRLLGQNPIYRIVECESDLALASRILARERSHVVHFSCHGCPDGVELTDGIFVGWRDLLGHFAFRQRQILSFSSCDVMSGDGICKAALECDEPPVALFGFAEEVAWDTAAL
ncbi:MAG: hypothetical protein ACIARR_05430, partial [Phycisphaerales bacterium JB059]